MTALKLAKSEPSELNHTKQGRPLLLGEIDKDVANHVRQIRDGIDVGGIVNQAIVIATALGIIKHKHKTFLSEFCGQIDINRSWGLSLLN